MRVVFFGTPEFAVPSLAALIDAGVDVAAVVTQPDRPRTRSHSTLLPPPVKVRAIAAGIPVLQPDRPRDESFYHQVRELGTDLGVVVAYGHILRPELLRIPRLGFVNVHASLLPRWRGAAPIHWALLSGDSDTGVAIMQVDAGLDTGAIWHERRIGIGERDTTASLIGQLSHLGAEALIEALPRIAAGDLPKPQPEAGASHAPKVTRDLARIDWNQPAAAVSCRIRAMDPVPGAWTTIGASELKVFGAQREAESAIAVQQPPGTIIQQGTGVRVAAATGAVEITDVQPAGRRRMPAAEWLRGAALPAGARFQ